MPRSPAVATARMAAVPGVGMASNQSTFSIPMLEIRKVGLAYSSGLRWRLRARSTSPFHSAWSSSRVRDSQRRSTGTTSPPSSAATAMPMSTCARSTMRSTGW